MEVGFADVQDVVQTAPRLRAAVELGRDLRGRRAAGQGVDQGRLVLRDVVNQAHGGLEIRQLHDDPRLVRDHGRRGQILRLQGAVVVQAQRVELGDMQPLGRLAGAQLLIVPQLVGIEDAPSLKAVLGDIAQQDGLAGRRVVELALQFDLIVRAGQGFPVVNRFLRVQRVA